MKSQGDIIALLSEQPFATSILRHVEELGLPDCWIGAGFVRNPVWDVLHDRKPFDTPLNDIDVLFFDPRDISPACEMTLERRLAEASPELNWSVKNQARMHIRNGDNPYRDTAHAMTHWSEICTALAARSVAGRIDISAPFGIADIIDLVVRPTPHFATKMDVYQDRIARKNWTRSWPKLTIYDDTGAILTPSSS